MNSRSGRFGNSGRARRRCVGNGGWFGSDGNLFKAEVAVYLVVVIGSKLHSPAVEAEVVDEDLYAAIDLVTDKLERQIRKNKTRLNKNIKEPVKEFNFDFEIDDDEDSDEKIVKRKNVEMKPMDEEEAILEMELLGHNFFVYKDMDTNKTCVLYKRKDGNYGLIETK